MPLRDSKPLPPYIYKHIMLYAYKQMMLHQCKQMPRNADIYNFINCLKNLLGHNRTFKRSRFRYGQSPPKCVGAFDTLCSPGNNSGGKKHDHLCRNHHHELTENGVGETLYSFRAE